MFRKLTRVAVAFAALFTTAANAVPLIADGQWAAFDVDDATAVSAGLEWIDLNGDALSFDFTLTGRAVLRVVDAGAYSGDRFELFDGSNSLGLTTAGAAGGLLPPPWLDFDAAFADHSHYSYLELLLNPGSYSLSGVLSESAVDEFGQRLNATVGAVSLTPVSEPGTGLLLALGAGAFGITTRRRPAGAR